MSIAFVGGGPRATGILERIVGRADDLTEPVDVHVIDPHAPGAGRIWRRDQDPLLWMNSVAADVAMLPDGSGGPTLAEWVLANRDTLVTDPALRDEIGRFTPSSFASRSLQSHYLAHVFESTVKARPDKVRVHVHRATVLDLSEHAGLQRLSLDSGEVLEVDDVVLAQGQPDTEPPADVAAFAHFAADHGLRYIGPGYTADLDPTVVPEREPVLVSGLGLAFVDWMVLLAESRGGTFFRSDDGTLVYTPSGREPLVYAGSRRGVPYHSKISYSIADAAPPLPRFFVPEAFPGTDILDFRADIWPLAVTELAWAHYYELFASHPDAVRGSFADLDSALERAGAAAVGDLVERMVPDPADRFDIDVLDRPLQHEQFDSLEESADRVHAYIDADLRRRRDPRFSADAAVFTGLLSVYRTVGELVRTQRLAPTDVATQVEGNLHSFFSFIASGPPPQRLEQLLALGRAGVIRYLGPNVRFDVDADGFRATSTAHPDIVRAGTLIEARLPAASISASADVLLRSLHERGEVREVRASPTSPAKLAVDGSSRVVDASGTAHPRRYAVGAWVAGHAWSGAFARPGIDAGFSRHNDGIAADLISSSTNAQDRRAV
ncbi:MULTISPECIES: FAD/NAD(P)-binding protein [unclassified Rhodococcus (in: high G+C Gram-positive bacteria)]|uniref:FAD/NAD(P)-binding protein n=1 Tax=unclassified Rhodococcus (in: high G+C Gram-positive bacteria) TaxID=192944 RepID=UPI0027DFD090|nr:MULTISPECIES: FAD/NAD(P)-binding protein [unclassified Rhodococcus (in: high G+C Gram-positive bacteria)]